MPAAGSRTIWYINLCTLTQIPDFSKSDPITLSQIKPLDCVQSLIKLNCDLGLPKTACSLTGADVEWSRQCHT